MARYLTLAIAALALFAGGTCGYASAATVEVGSVTRIRGEASAETTGKAHALAADAKIDMGDRLTTGPGARLEVTFFDGTLLTLGERADFTVDELTVSPGKGTALFTRTAGAIRLLAGSVSKQAENRVEIAGNAGTIGIRGTEVWGGTVKPGSQLDVFLIEGSVEVRSAAGSVVLDRAGLGTSIAAVGGPPAAPVQWAPALRDQALATVSFDSP